MIHLTYTTFTSSIYSRTRWTNYGGDMSSRIWNLSATLERGMKQNNLHDTV